MSKTTLDACAPCVPVRAGLSRWVLADRRERVRAGKDAFSAHTFFMTNPSLSGRGSALKKAKSTAPRLVLDD